MPLTGWWSLYLFLILSSIALVRIPIYSPLKQKPQEKRPPTCIRLALSILAPQLDLHGRVHYARHHGPNPGTGGCKLLMSGVGGLGRFLDLEVSSLGFELKT